MRRAVILITLAILILASASFAEVKKPFLRHTEIRATVLSVIKRDFPLVDLRLRVTEISDPSMFRLPSREITVENYFPLKNSSPDWRNPDNSGSIAAFYLLQGDEIHAKLFSGINTSGRPPRWYVFDISRINTGLPGKCPEGKVYGNLSLTLSTDKTSYRVGEPVQMTLSIRNVGNTHEILRFRNGQRYDFLVTREGNDAWQWSWRKAFTMALGSHDLAPGAALEYQATWPQSDRDKRQVVPGSYEIVGFLSDEHHTASDAVKVTIQP